MYIRPPTWLWSLPQTRVWKKPTTLLGRRRELSCTVRSAEKKRRRLLARVAPYQHSPFYEAAGIARRQRRPPPETLEPGAGGVGRSTARARACQ